MEQLELYLSYSLLAGVLVVLAGWLWLVLAATRVRWMWGLAMFLFVVPALFFIILHFRKSIGPLLVMLLGGAIIAAPYGVSMYTERYVDLGPREKTVEGELHITLTGWEKGKDDYAILKKKPGTAVLQMANADVDDGVLESLRGMNELYELDLNDTKVTDQGLTILAGLPKLKIVRLRNTAITDEGFREHLLAKETLMEVDLRGTKVTGKTAREWKEAKPDRKYLR